MNENESINSMSEKNSPPYFLFFILFLAGWTLAIGGLFIITLKSEYRQITELSLFQARAFFEEMVTARSWNAGHGGIYVPVTPENQPNPYLKVPDRDVETKKGRKLTKINPAYMTRQIAELASVKNKVKFHITSLNLLRPANAPDSWEAEALKSFNSEKKEKYDWIVSDDGQNIFRYMAPLWTEASCLKCHSQQGYKEGDLRGGISVSIQADSILKTQRRQIITICLTYLVIWLLGVLASVSGYQDIKKRFFREMCGKLDRMINLRYGR